MFRDNLTRIGQICMPYKFVQSGCIPPKIKCEILAHKKGSQTTRQVRRLSRLLKLQTNGTRDLLASMTMDQDFLGKRTHYRNVFFLFLFFFPSRSLSGAMRRTTQSWPKLPKAKEKPVAKMEKNWKMCWGARQWIDRQLSELRFEAAVNVFVSRLA